MSGPFSSSLPSTIWEGSLSNNHPRGTNLLSSLEALQGYLVDWDAQKAIWDGVFSPEVLNVRTLVGFIRAWATLSWLGTQVDTAESSLLITEPYFNLPNIQDVYDQFVFEEYEFHSYHRCTRKFNVLASSRHSVSLAASLTPYGHLFRSGGASPPECLVVIDSGFSFTHVVPIMNNQIQWYAVKR